MKKETKKDVLIAIITGIASIIAGFVGGSALNNNTNTNVNTNTNTPNISISVNGDTSSVTYEEASQIIADQNSEINRYKSLYEAELFLKNALIDENQKLGKENDYLSNSIENLTNENKKLGEKCDTLSAEVGYLKASSSAGVGSPNETFQDTSIEEDNFTGEYVLLSKMDYLYDSDEHYETFEVKKDNYGNEHYDIICGGMDRTFYINNEYKSIEGKFFHLYDRRSKEMKGKFTIYGDGAILYNQSELEVGWKPIDFAIDISTIEELRIVLDVEVEMAASANNYFLAALSDVRLYKK